MTDKKKLRDGEFSELDAEQIVKCRDRIDRVHVGRVPAPVHGKDRFGVGTDVLFDIFRVNA